MTTTAPRLSVIICTHNPREIYLGRTLASLRGQTLPFSDWELIVIDNASTEPVATRTDLTWHPSGRFVAEAEIGLTAARLRGIAEARAELLVFVDDDNALAPDYLERALDLSAAWPMLGVWGCGDYTPEWEMAPPPDFAEYLRYLAVHRAAGDRWSNRPFDYDAMPAGAGLCVRASVGRRYAGNVRGDPRRKRLGRTGGNLACCEDFDLALTSIELGLGTGVFTILKMIHFMPRQRIEESYLLRLVESHACSTVLLHALRDAGFHPAQGGLIARLRDFRFRRSLGPVARKIHEARRRGERRGWEQFSDLSSESSAARPKSQH